MCRSHSETDLEEIIMPLNAHGRRPQGRPLVSRTAVVLTVALLAGTWTMAAQAPADGRTQAVLTVLGMQCPFCAYGIQKHLKKLPGVTKVEVELAENQAIVTVAPDAEVTDEDLQRAIRKAGFTPGTIEWRREDQLSVVGGQFFKGAPCLL